MVFVAIGYFASLYIFPVQEFYLMSILGDLSFKKICDYRPPFYNGSDVTWHATNGFIAQN